MWKSRVNRQKPLIDASFDALIPDPTELRIRTATATDRIYLADRSYKFRKQMGWTPDAWLDQAIDRRLAWIVEIQGQPAGYTLITGGDRRPCTLRHNCVEHELWDRGLGTLFTSAFLGWCLLTTGHRTACVRTRQDIVPQNLINCRTGGKPVKVDAPRPSAGPHAVVTWAWQIRQRPRRRVWVEDQVGRNALLAWMPPCRALPEIRTEPVQIRGRQQGSTREAPATQQGSDTPPFPLPA